MARRKSEKKHFPDYKEKQGLRTRRVHVHTNPSTPLHPCTLRAEPEKLLEDLQSPQEPPDP